MNEQVQIGVAKTGRRGYGFSDIAVIPDRRTRDTEDISLGWGIDAYRFDIPVLGAPTDSCMSPETVIALGKAGGLGVLDLEGLWTRYDNPSVALKQIRDAKPEEAGKTIQQVYAEPVKPELIKARLAQIRESGVVVAGALSPQSTAEYHQAVIDAGVDMFVIRGTAVSAEHVSTNHEPLNLKKFIYELDVPVIVGGAGTYTTALHLMRTGAAGVLAGFGGGATSYTVKTLGLRTPMATTIADIAGARRDYLDESGGRYVHVIADGPFGAAGDIPKAFACGADAVMLGAALARASEAPGHGYLWGPEAKHPELPRGSRAKVGVAGTFEEVLFGPAHDAEGALNIMGALRKTMATTGYTDLKEFQKVQVAVARYVV